MIAVKGERFRSRAFFFYAQADPCFIFSRLIAREVTLFMWKSWGTRVSHSRVFLLLCCAKLRYLPSLCTLATILLISLIQMYALHYLLKLIHSICFGYNLIISYYLWEVVPNKTAEIQGGSWGETKGGCKACLWIKAQGCQFYPCKHSCLSYFNLTLSEQYKWNC